MKLEEKIKEKIVKALVNATIGTICMGVVSMPWVFNEVYVKATTDSLKKYKVHIERVDTSRIGGFGNKQFYVHVSGDTTGVLYQWDCNRFEQNKDYEFNLRRYGIFGENRIENVQEITP